VRHWQIVCLNFGPSLRGEIVDEGVTEMEYRLEIYALGGHDEDNCIKVFTAAAPFPPLHVGDLLDASGWEHTRFRVLRVRSVEHVIMEKESLGIDPSGRIIHRALINTEGVPDSVRYEVPAAS
jgi:hypothetical protein